MRWRGVMRKLFMLVAGMLFFSFAGCSTNGLSIPKADSKTLYETEWKLLSINGDHVAGSKIPTLKIDEDGRFGGFGGCNEYFGRAKVSGHTIFFGAIGSTRRYCIAGHALEHSYFEALQGPKHWRIKSSGKLLLYDDVNRLIFVPKR